MASEEAESQNIEYYKKAVGNFLKNPLIERLSGVGWDDIFDVIINAKINKKTVIVFDEFQNLCKTNPAFASIVQRIWDEKLKKPQFYAYFEWFFGWHDARTCSFLFKSFVR